MQPIDLCVAVLGGILFAGALPASRSRNHILSPLGTCLMSLGGFVPLALALFAASWTIISGFKGISLSAQSSAGAVSEFLSDSLHPLRTALVVMVALCTAQAVSQAVPSSKASPETRRPRWLISALAIVVAVSAICILLTRRSINLVISGCASDSTLQSLDLGPLASAIATSLNVGAVSAIALAVLALAGVLLATILARPEPAPPSPYLLIAVLVAVAVSAAVLFVRVNMAIGYLDNAALTGSLLFKTL